jgi:hypothetical protein
MRGICVVALIAALVGLPARAANYTDWWWGGPALSGQGVNVGQQGNLVFVSWFAYDEQGDGMWVVFSGPLDAAGETVAGTFYRTIGPALGTPFDPGKVVATPVGTGSLAFADMHRATFAWNVAGKSGTVPLVRQTYGASRFAGDFDGVMAGNLHCPGDVYYPDPTDTPLREKGALSIAVAGDQAIGSVQYETFACGISGTFGQSGQMVHITGTTSCPSPVGMATLDLTLLVLDRAVVGWQKTLSMTTGCVRTEQFSMVRRN